MRRLNSGDTRPQGPTARVHQTGQGTQSTSFERTSRHVHRPPATNNGPAAVLHRSSKRNRQRRVPAGNSLHKTCRNNTVVISYKAFSVSHVRFDSNN